MNKILVQMFLLLAWSHSRKNGGIQDQDFHVPPKVIPHNIYTALLSENMAIRLFVSPLERLLVNKIGV